MTSQLKGEEISHLRSLDIRMGGGVERLRACGVQSGAVHIHRLKGP
jgi:hypothetical protein